MLVHLEQLQRVIRHFLGDGAFSADLCEIAHAAQQPVGNPRRAARTPCQLGRGCLHNRHIQNARRAADDLLQVRLRVEVQAMDDAEARAQGRGEQAGSRGCADQRKFLQRHFDRSRPRSLTYHDVQLVIFHGGIQNLFDRRRHPVNLVDEQHFAVAQAGENRRKVAGTLQDRTGRGAHRGPELCANHVRKRGLAQTGRAI